MEMRHINGRFMAPGAAAGGELTANTAIAPRAR
jgi:hypothetical protein